MTDIVMMNKEMTLFPSNKPTDYEDRSRSRKNLTICTMFVFSKITSPKMAKRVRHILHGLPDHLLPPVFSSTISTKKSYSHTAGPEVPGIGGRHPSKISWPYEENV